MSSCRARARSSIWLATGWRATGFFHEPAVQSEHVRCCRIDKKSAGPRTTRSCGSGAATPKGGELDAGGARNRGRAQAGWARGALGGPDQASHCLCFALADCCDPAASRRRQIRSDGSSVGWRAHGTGAFGAARSTDEPHGLQRARAGEPGRGRHGQAPWHIPWKGWKDIFWRTYQQIGEDRLLAVAAGVVFYGLLAVFPAVTALVSLYGLFASRRQSAINSRFSAEFFRTVLLKSSASK